ncbi:hypothetical protein [Methanobrevibacter sp.]
MAHVRELKPSQRDVIENINKILKDNHDKSTKEIVKLINKYCTENPSIIEIPTKVLNKNIKVDSHSFNKCKNKIRFKAKSYKSKSKQKESNFHQAEKQLESLIKHVVEIRNLGCRPIEA